MTSDTFDRAILSFVAGLACAAGIVTLTSSSRPAVVVCEAGSFEAVTDAADPYRKAEARCTFETADGQPVTVAIID